MLPDRLAFVDIETTGARASYDRVIEIGIVRVEDNEVTQTYHTLINPQSYLPPEIEMLTGITMKDLEGQPTFHEVAKDILEVLADCVFVAHNVRFDYGFLKHAFLREEINYSSKHFCTVKLSRALYPAASHHNLDAIIQRFGFTCEKRHRAFEDAKILWEFYKHSLKQFPEDVFVNALNVALRRPTIPIKLNFDDLDALPDLPGVYIFYGPQPDFIPETASKRKKNGVDKLISANGTQTHLQMPLYIGKSKNIRDRVLSHFSGDIHSPTEMNIAQQVERIETIVTAGELGALFLESQLVKKMLPIYNKMLRVKRELVALRKVTDTNGYETIKMEALHAIAVDDLDSFLGFFRSKKQAKEFLSDMCKEYGLCEKLLGLEKTPTACFGYRLDTCKGACVGDEKPLFYNLRFTTAFYKTKIKPWPFTGPVLIEEKNELTGTIENFLVDKWCYLGSVKTTALDTSTVQVENEYVFDLDMYKILLRFLYKSENMKKVRVLKHNELQKIQSEGWIRADIPKQ